MNINTILPYYIGCKVIVDEKEEGVLRGGCFVPNSIDQVYYDIQTEEMKQGEDEDFSMPHNCDYNSPSRIKPILRKLSSMTENEAKAGSWSSLRHYESYCEYHKGAFHPEDFHYLLSCGFDLFSLIENNLAIDATLNQQP